MCHLHCLDYTGQGDKLVQCNSDCTVYNCTSTCHFNIPYQCMCIVYTAFRKGILEWHVQYTLYIHVCILYIVYSSDKKLFDKSCAVKTFKNVLE